ncbi:MAG: glycosyltransferase family 39 protein [Rhodobacteraceae bacterium]|nr:glycosyltransferase family 39 protein [Paracoccaceae bacterium]
MPSLRSEYRTALIFIVAVTLWRLVLLPFNSADISFDEAQYWLWGQNLDLGYYSKPPMIAWLGRLVTDLAGSSSQFWVRAPGPILHGITAVLVMLTAGRLFGRRAAAWVGAAYVTLPFYAAALFAYVGLTRQSSLGWAVALGVFTGLGMLSKYAMTYLPLTIALAALLLPMARIAWRDAFIAVAAGLVALSPNIYWNIQNAGATVRHTVNDNANWDQASLSLTRGLEFIGNQFAVFGPILFGAFLVLAIGAVLRRTAPVTTWMMLLSAPVVILMTAQGIQSQAHANWAITAYVAGTIGVVSVLHLRAPLLNKVSLGFHTVITLAFPVFLIFVADLTGPEGRPLAKRWVGVDEMSEAIWQVAQDEGLNVIVAGYRPISADLHYTLRDRGAAIFTPTPPGYPANYYEQVFALPTAYSGDALFVGYNAALPCAPEKAELIATLPATPGLYQDKPTPLYRIGVACFLDARP